VSAPLRPARAAAGALLLALACGAAPATVEVVAVHDGDTVTVLQGREQVRVRLACIDAPEQGQPFGSRARQALADRVMRRHVALEVVDRDDYGRTVARLRLDGEDVNLQMVRAGLAWHYRYHCPDDRALAAAESEARSERRGLWLDARPEPPWEWRRHK
jgi:endonuclease YncB( thermonuclease family)